MISKGYTCVSLVVRLKPIRLTTYTDTLTIRGKVEYLRATTFYDPPYRATSNGVEVPFNIHLAGFAWETQTFTSIEPCHEYP